jgi:anti-sigma regulatory factor (Ser/Thr protein kinase)
VPAARRFVRDVLREQSRELLDAVELMASELATNCIHHAQTCFELKIDDAQSQVRVEVRDSGQGRPVPRSPAPTDRTGRGLRIVEALADAWGVDRSSSGKTVWFTVPQDAGPPAESPAHMPSDSTVR